MSDQPQYEPYKESDDHVPNPMYQRGVVDTTGTSGDLGGRIENISPVFAQAKADAFGNAADAIDDPDRDESEVVTYHDSEVLSDEETRARTKEVADELANSEQVQTGLTPAQQEAAEEGDDTNPDTGTKGDDAGVDSDGDADGSDAEDDADGDDLPNESEAKGKFEDYADKHGLDVDKSLHAAEYKAAVRKAAKK